MRIAQRFSGAGRPALPTFVHDRDQFRRGRSLSKQRIECATGWYNDARIGGIVLSSSTTVGVLMAGDAVAIISTSGLTWLFGETAWSHGSGLQPHS
jgi:hypothetical protein